MTSTVVAGKVNPGVLLTVLLVASIAYGQEAAEAAPNLGFRDVILGGGPVNMPIWGALFLLQIAVIPAAMAVLSGAKVKRGLLVGGIVLGVVLGLLGTVAGMVQAFAGLAGEAGAAKAEILAMAISSALWSTMFGTAITVQYVILIVINSSRNRQSEPPPIPKEGA